MHTTVTCPQTGAAVNFELPVDGATLAQHWRDELRFECPVCKGTHAVTYRNAYVTGVMSMFACVPVDIQRATIH